MRVLGICFFTPGQICGLSYPIGTERQPACYAPLGGRNMQDDPSVVSEDLTDNFSVLFMDFFPSLSPLKVIDW